MLSYPRLQVNLNSIENNARILCSRLGDKGIGLVGVTKAVMGDPKVAKAMLAGGISELADSRLKNVERMRSAGINSKITLIRSPAPSEISQCVNLADGSLNTDTQVIGMLNRAALKLGKIHEITIMVDLDTGREGVLPSDVSSMCSGIRSMDGLQLKGLGIYFGFEANSLSFIEKLSKLSEIKDEVEAQLGSTLHIFSGGSTNIFHTLSLEDLSSIGVNELRLGTAILLGLSSSIGPQTIESCKQDTFVLSTEIIEIKKNNGVKAVLGAGKIDFHPSFAFPTITGISIIDSSSDHTLIQYPKNLKLPEVGDLVSFKLGYYSLINSMLSPYIKIDYLEK